MALGNLQSMIEQIQEELEEYENLKAQLVSSVELEDVTLIPEILIKARIYRGWTQEQLGEKLGLSAQQIQRYEKQLFMTANLERVINLFHALEIDIHANINLTGVQPEIVVSDFVNDVTVEITVPTFEEDENIIAEKTGLKIRKNRRQLRRTCVQTQGIQV